MTEGGGERSFDALSQVGVIELGGPLRLAYCGALLAQLGAAVVVVAAASDCAAPSDAIDAAARSALARAKQGAETVEEAASLLAGRRLVLVCDGRAPPGLADDLAATHGPVSEVRLDAHDAAGAPGLRGGGNALTACAVAAASHAIGHPDREPLPVPEEFVEHTCGLHAAVTAVLALLAGAPAAAAGGRAQALHSAVAMDECVRFYVGMNAKMYENYPRIWQREGRRSAGSAGPYPVGLFRCADGYVVIVSRSRADWHAIVAAMGSPAWARRPGWEDPIVVAERHADEADVLLGQWLDGLTCEQAVALGGKHGFAIARMLDPLEAVTTEQMRSRGFARSDGAVTVDARLPAIVTRAPAPGGRRLPRRQREPSTLLAGVRVLDLSWVWSGPAAAMMLAALGATVVKVESRLRPDGSRLRGRPVVNGVPVAGPELEVTPYFHQVNAGKQSVELDLGSAEGRDAIRALA
ncbi:MAG TPA: CoA transferase, partial [Solirubrobacteraceae bacterium]|nr:CoA transferase [Solirubrobacteraceae bacterium]